MLQSLLIQAFKMT